MKIYKYGATICCRFPFKNLPSSLLFVFICILKRSSSKKITQKYTNRCSCPPATANVCERKQTDHVQIMGLSVCTIYCPLSTRFLYKFFIFFLHRGNVSIQRAVACKSGNLFTSRKGRVFVIWQQYSREAHKILSISYDTCIIFFFIAPGKPTRFAIILKFPHIRVLWQ